jgi:uncharacterized membrane protein YgdD (TMEM256/DUF423 family)
VSSPRTKNTVPIQKGRGVFSRRTGLVPVGCALAGHGRRGQRSPHACGHASTSPPRTLGTAVRYLAIGGLGLLALGLAAHLRPGRAWGVAGIFLSIGALVFSGTVSVLALGGPRWVGMVTPLGGVLLTAGFLAMALAAGRS